MQIKTTVRDCLPPVSVAFLSILTKGKNAPSPRTTLCVNRSARQELIQAPAEGGLGPSASLAHFLFLSLQNSLSVPGSSLERGQAGGLRGWVVTQDYLEPLNSHPHKVGSCQGHHITGSSKNGYWTSRHRNRMRSSVAFGNVHWSQSWTWRHRIKILIKTRIRLRTQCSPDFYLLQGHVAKMTFSLGKFPVGNRFPSMNETGV